KLKSARMPCGACTGRWVWWCWRSRFYSPSERRRNGVSPTPGCRTGFRWCVAGAEIVAVLLFLVSPAVVIGGYLLLVIFAVAVLVHVLHGWWDVGSLIVYAMAVLVILSGKTQKHQGS